MNSPRSGFRRAAIASWALAGLGAAGVVGASALAFSDTVKPAAVEDLAAAEQPAAPATAVNLPTVALAPSTVEAPAAPVAAQTAFGSEPIQTYARPAPQYTQAPVQTYAPAPVQTYAPAPAAVPQGAIGGSASSSGKSSSGLSGSRSQGSSSSSTKRVPMGSSGGPNKAVPHTTAHGS